MMKTEPADISNGQRESVAARNGIIVVGGPDGSGKSALCGSLEDGALEGRVLRIHHRPAFLPKRTSGEVTDPRAKPPYGPVLSLLKVLYLWVDFSLGWAIRVRPFARHGWVLLERGWTDLLVDPLRYRLAPGGRALRLLGRFVPSSDLSLVLEVPAETLAQRKDELSVEELARQSRAWREIAKPSRAVVYLDGTLSPEAVRRAALEAIARIVPAGNPAPTNEWTNLPHKRSPRWILPRRPRSVVVAALRIHQPMTIGGMIAWLGARVFAMVGGFRFLPRGDPPPTAVAEALAPHVSPDSFVALARTADPGMWTALIVDVTGRMRAIGGVATSARARARLEQKLGAAMNVPELPPPLMAPRIVGHSDSVLLFEAVKWQLRVRPWRLQREIASSLGAFFGDAFASDEGPSHGDFAPWNILRTSRGWAVIDWEEASLKGGSPFHDLFHYLVQAHVLLRRPSRRALISGLRGRGWVGEAVREYAKAAGRLDRDAMRSFVSYLETSIPRIDLSRPEAQRHLEARQRLLRMVAQDLGERGRG
jgi:phosphotransferase family enzyme